MKVDLETTRPGRVKELSSKYWSQSAPFLFNPRAYLIHRVRFVQSLTRDGKLRHHAYAFWCGNSTCNGGVVHEPPGGRLVCAVCEANAVANGQPSSDELVGRHVHLGRLRAIQSCCKSNSN